MKTRVEDPHIITVESEKDRKEIEQKILNYMMSSPKSKFRHPKCLVFISSFENNYGAIKDICINYRIPSQVITIRKALGFNLSVATNIMR